MRKIPDHATLAASFKRFLKQAAHGGMSRSAMLRKLHIDAKTCDEIASMLILQGEVKAERVDTGGRTKAIVYSLQPDSVKDSRLETIGKLIEAAVQLAMQKAVAA